MRFLSVLLVLFFTPLLSLAEDLSTKYQKALFAGGCFWCMEPPFDKLDGVISTTSGYSGGSVKNPDYKSVTKGKTGHYEVLQVVFDPKRVSFEELLKVFWVNIDPLDGNGQFCDKGPQYLSALFYFNEEQKKQAQLSLERLERSGVLKEGIKTELLEAGEFYPAERYHQDYYLKNPVRYKYYRTGCGRDVRLFELWKNKTFEEWVK